MDTYQQYIASSRYARWNYDLSRRETWPETVERFISFWRNKDLINDKEKEELQEAVLNLEVMPSMRCLMTAGPALERDNTAAFNCSFLPINHPRAFDELLYILSCGTGVGFSVEKKYVNKLPEVAEDFHPTETTINVADSKIGWAKSFRELVSLLYAGQVPYWDMSKVRPAGSPLKTFGGRASGPEPLEELFVFTVDMFKKAVGRPLTTLECHDLCCKIAEVIVSGGVRRSALISLSDPSDNRLRDAKSGQWWIEDSQRALANNSAVYTSKPDFKFFMDEMRALYESKSGERGIFSREASKILVERNGRRDADWDFGTNPCFSGDTLIAVADGRNAVTIKDLAEENKPFPVYCASQTNVANQYGQSDTFSYWKDEVKTGIAFKTGTKKLIKVTLSTGDIFRCTPDHKLALPDGTYKEAKDCLGKQLHRFYTVKNKYRRINEITNAFKNQHRMIWEYYNGEIENNMVVDHIVSGSKDFIDNLQLLSKKEHDEKSGLERRGEKNPVHRIEDTEAWKNNISNVTFLYNNPRFLGITNEELIENGKILLSQGKKITLKNLKELDDRTPQSFSKNRFEGKVSVLRDICEGNIKYSKPEQTHRIEKKKQDYPHIVEDVFVELIEEDGTEDVYDVKVEENSNFYIITSTVDKDYENCRGILVHNCSEIILRPNQFCNLSEVVVREKDTVDDLKRKVRLATILGTLQATLTDFRYLRQTWKRNTEEEALLGVSLTGIMDHPILNGTKHSNNLPQILEEMKQVAIDTNKEWAKKLKINQSAAITCVKPSGTVSQLVNSASGIHPRFAPYYIRTVRADVKDPLAQYMKEAGFPCEVDVTKASNLVFSFPIKSPDNAICAEEIGALRQLELWKIYQEHWAEHKPSITVYYKDDEFLDVYSWIWKNFDMMSGISLLPYSDHIYKQAPYQPITKEEYEEFKKKMPEKLDWEEAAKFEENIDSTTSSHELACSAAGGCEL